MAPLRAAFIGSVTFSRSVLERLVELGVDVRVVVTRADPGRHSDFADLSEVCDREGIPCLRTSNANSAQVKRVLREAAVDVVFCIGWSQLLDGEVLRIPRLGTVGYHPAMVPENRGRHPLIWAIALGMDHAGSTFMLLDEGADTGGILEQERIEMAPRETAASLYEKMTRTAVGQLGGVVRRLAAGDVSVRSQERAGGNTWRKRGIDDGRIDWRMSVDAIDALVRALGRPYPGAHFHGSDGTPVTVWSAEPYDGPVPGNLEPGRVVEVEQGGAVVVRVWDGAVRLLEIEPRPELAQGDCLV